MAGVPSAFVLGGGLITLGVARSLGRRGIPLTVFHDGKDDIAAHSRYVRAIRLADSSDSDSTIGTMIELAKQETAKPVLLISGDRALLQACRNEERLKPWFHLLLPPVAAAETIVSKEQFRIFAESSNAPVPKSWVPHSRRELEELAVSLRYPVVLKPVRSVDWQTPALVARQGHIKMILVTDQGSLFDHWERLASFGASALLQEYIGGGDSDHYSYVSYRNATGRELAGMCIRKLRLNPVHGGLATLAYCIEEHEMRAASQQLLDQLQYASVASVCFKRDPESGKAFIFEVNGRLPLVHGALAANGVDLPWLMYRDAQGLTCAPETATPGAARWISLSHDIWAVRDYMRCGKLGWREWLQSLRNVRYVVEFDLRDPGVFFWLLRQLFRQALVGLGSRFRAATMGRST